MAKKSIWDIDLWKTVIALAIFLAIIASTLYILQELGKINLWASWKDFFATQLSTYVFVVAVIIVTVFIYEVDAARSARKAEIQEKNIPDSQDAEVPQLYVNTMLPHYSIELT